MNFFTNAIIQALATAGHMANLFGAAPPKAQPYVAAGLAILQAVTGLIAHFSNPDGTPASVAFEPKK